MKTIKIAPDLDEIYINDEKICTEWNYGIEYSGPIGTIREMYKDEWIKKQFQTAIAICSKSWQLEKVLNDYFGIKGKIS